MKTSVQLLYTIIIAGLIILLNCTPVSQPPGDSSPAVPEWRTVLNEKFEGAFPGTYQIFDNDGAANGEYYWAKKGDKKNSGNYSLWAIGSGANGSLLAGGANYPDNCKSWIIAGPYDFSKATDVKGSFYYWLNSQSGVDLLKYGFSTDGSNFNCAGMSGTSGGWLYKDMGLAGVKEQIAGKPQVWFAFLFITDGSTNLSDGAYIDDIHIEKFE